jgi:hypothetical protein
MSQPDNNDDITKEEEVWDKGDVDIDTGEESEQSEGGDFEEGNPDGTDDDGSVTIKECKNARKHVHLSSLVGRAKQGDKIVII